MYLCLPFRLRGRMAQIRVLFIGHTFILGVPGMAIAGMDIITTLTFSNVTCYEAIPGLSMEVV